LSTSLVITSIASPNSVLRAYAAGCGRHDIDFIIIGDRKSPTEFSLDGCNFLSLDSQIEAGTPLAAMIPENHYARKNLGYLLAMARGAEVIIETDDDNLPTDGFWQERSATALAHQLEHAGWVNPLRHFSTEPVWPRGFPLEFVQKPVPDFTAAPFGRQHCPIQQGLADGDPDLDAVFRLTRPLPPAFSAAAPLALGKNSWAPFNSQNTTWFKEAFPLLYLPSHCSFRMCDIWRSFVAQRICWDNGWHVLFHGATVTQKRNEHDLLTDFREEIAGYLNNAIVCRELASLQLPTGVQQIADAMVQCYEVFIKRGLIDESELDLLAAWLTSVQRILAGR